MAPVTAVVSICREPSAKSTVTVTVTVLPNNVQVAPVIVTVAERVPPGLKVPPQVGVVDEGEHPVTG